MPDKFISNGKLVDLLTLATNDERLALTKLLDSDEESPYDAKTLQEKICLEGGRGIANLFRGQGTGYLDILDDVVDALKIYDTQSYNSEVKYFDEIYYIKGEGEATSRTYNRQEATELGIEYASNTEEKIIVGLIKKSYEMMIDQKDKIKSKSISLQEDKRILNSEIDKITNTVNELKKMLLPKGFFGDLFTAKVDKIDINNKIESFEGRLENKRIKKREIELEAQEKESELKEVIKRIDEFDNTINKVSKEFDVSHSGKITGAAGIMILANLGGFATYTFLTSMMSILSFGTLGFGAYTAATSLLSIIIGPVGWAGLGIFALFSLGKPNMSKLLLIVATIGAIRQRVKYG